MHFSGIKNVIFYSIVLLNFDILTEDINARPKVPNGDRKLTRRRSIVAMIFSNATVTKNVSSNKTVSCRWLRGYKNQNKMCRKRKGLSDALMQARNLAVTNCEEQFRWNCSINKNLFKKIFRETSFLYAIGSSAIMYSIAKACASGLLENCKCASQDKSNDRPNWKWGGCGDNTEQSRKITRKFLQLKQNGDGPQSVLHFNSFVGMKIVEESKMKVCKCHGISASCVMKTCWKSLHPFEKISAKLKESYHNAVQHLPSNAIKQVVKKINKNPERLLYLVQSPSFCQSTIGRRCRDIENCATLCCARGFESKQYVVYRRCNCRWQQCCFEIMCDTCSENETKYICK